MYGDPVSFSLHLFYSIPGKFLQGKVGKGLIDGSLAHAELYLTLATVFRRYGGVIRLWETERRDVEPARDFFVPAPEDGGNGLRVVVG